MLTAPARVDGVYVADGVVGDYLCARYGDLQSNPLSVTIENSRIVDVRCATQDLVDDFRAYTSTDENSNRVGEFAIGTNIASHDVIGNILQDEKLPTLHIAFGHPYAEHTGANWQQHDPHRHRRPPLRHLVRRRPGHGGREVPDLTASTSRSRRRSRHPEAADRGIPNSTSTGSLARSG